MALGEVGEFRSLFLDFEALVALADGGLRQGFARLQGGDVSADAVLFLLLVALAVFIQREAQLLNGGDDDLVGVIVREKAADEVAVLVFSSTQPS